MTSAKKAHIGDAEREIANTTGLRPHAYLGIGHMIHPDDFIECCRHFGDHPIHHPDLRPTSAQGSEGGAA